MKSRTLWLEVFRNSNPVEIEIGSGTGAFLLQASEENPDRNYFGIEHSRSRAAMVEQALAEHPLTNARIIAADAACVVRHLVPPASVHAYHIYFPDPWWKRRHHRRRLVNEDLASDLARTLVPGGYVYTATDVNEVFERARAALIASRRFQERTDIRLPQRSATVFERKGIASGALIREGAFQVAGKSP